jgi:hypothetical protein
VPSARIERVVEKSVRDGLPLTDQTKLAKKSSLDTESSLTLSAVAAAVVLGVPIV